MNKKNELALGFFEIASELAEKRQYEKSLIYFEMCEPLFLELLPHYHPNVEVLYQNLANVCWALLYFERAREYWQERSYICVQKKLHDLLEKMKNNKTHKERNLENVLLKPTKIPL